MFAQRKKGFTLIELLVVIAIIGILSSVVLASLNSARRKGRDSRRVADIKQLQLALELWYDACGSYPSAVAEGTATGCAGTGGLVSNGYISVIPTDPSGSHPPYKYTQLTSGSDYHLGANLEDSTHSSLSTDADKTSTNVDGDDTDGCEGETDRYCFDVKP